MSRSDMYEKIMRILDGNEIRKLEDLHKRKNSKMIAELIDLPITSIQGLKLNALGYALFYARLEGFKILSSKLGCSLRKMHGLFQVQHTSALEILCKKGYAEFLGHVLPSFTSEDFEIYSGACKENTFTPIQVATEKGHVSVINTIFQYLKDVENTPEAIDWNYCDENTGENCALIACRTGNLMMVRTLHELCKANFKVINKLGENAVQIAAAGSRHKPHLKYGQILCYLTEIVGLDITENYEETLLLVEDEEIIAFVEKKLKKHGINTSKSEVEARYKVGSQTRSQNLKGLSFPSSISLISTGEELFVNSQIDDLNNIIG